MDIILLKIFSNTLFWILVLTVTLFIHQINDNKLKNLERCSIIYDKTNEELAEEIHKTAKFNNKFAWILLIIYICGFLYFVGLLINYDGAFEVKESSAKQVLIEDSTSRAIVIPKTALSKKKEIAMATAKTIDLIKDADSGDIKCIVYPIFSQGVSIGKVEVNLQKGLKKLRNE